MSDHLPPQKLRPPEHFTLHFREVPNPLADPLAVPEPDAPTIVEVTIAGEPGGSLVLTEGQWSAIWRAIVHSTRAFEERGITLIREGRFR